MRPANAPSARSVKATLTGPARATGGFAAGSQALLKAHESTDPFLEPRAGGFLKQPARPSPRQDSPPSAPVNEKPGDKIGDGKLLRQMGDGGSGVGRYAVEEMIGAGGMGEVYRARDQSLQRAVALKVLPAASSFDPERLARLGREARMLAALNHPNIATIHGLEEAEGKRFLVLELVEGQTLAERLKGGRLPAEEALELGRQIAEGLEAAHEKGIVHRDLKPANIKVTPEGKVKILDFGLAKAFHDEQLPADLGGDPTLTGLMGHPGAILGTAAYMSPEQARGKPVDKRTDIWAFGCVLYECLTGERAFAGETITETLAAVLKSDPDWEALPVATPWKVKDLLQRCLRKDPRDRLHDIADARIELQEQLALPGEALQARGRPRPGWLIAASMTALVAGLLIGAAVMSHFSPGVSPVPQRPGRFIVRLEPGQWLEGQRRNDRPTWTAMAISSAGRFIVYSAVKENPGAQDKPCLYLRRLDQLEAKPIAGTEGGSSPFLSPDDRWVGFWADKKLMKVPVEGGVPAALCDVASPFGFSWGADDRIIFPPKSDSGLWRISAAGGQLEVLTQPDKLKDEGFSSPALLPACRKRNPVHHHATLLGRASTGRRHGPGDTTMARVARRCCRCPLCSQRPACFPSARDTDGGPF